MLKPKTKPGQGCTKVLKVSDYTHMHTLKHVHVHSHMHAGARARTHTHDHVIHAYVLITTVQLH